MKNNIIVWVLIVIIFTGGLVFFTSRKAKAPDTQEVSQVNQNTNMQNIQQVDGVKIMITKQGAGEVAKTGDTVSMNYTGKFENGTAFDSNIDPKFGHVQPFEFTIGAGMVIKGWDIGIAGMKVGEQRNLVIQPNFAYGPKGYGPIPPNATLSFDVELVAIKK